MKLTFLLFSALFFINALKGQENRKFWQVDSKNDFFWEPGCPVMDGYTLWLLRQRLTLDGYQTILYGETDVENERLNKIQFTNYLPLFAKRNFRSMIGTRYSKFDFLPENYNLGTSIQHLWLWTAWKYLLDRWDFTLTTENYLKGDELGLNDKTGNKFMSIFYAGYELNSKWDIILLTGYDVQQMEGEVRERPIIAAQGRFQPSSGFKMLFGAPAIFACEWTIFPKTGIGAKYFITGESQFFVRQKFSKNFGVSCLYNSDFNKSNDTYFNSIVFQSQDNTVINYNNITYKQHQLSAEFNFNLFDDVGFSVGFGYNLQNKMQLYSNSSLVSDNFSSKNNFFINTTLQLIRDR